MFGRLVEFLNRPDSAGVVYRLGHTKPESVMVEIVFSAAKRKLSSRAPGRLPVTQHLQTLLLGLAYDIYRVRRALVPFAS